MNFVEKTPLPLSGLLLALVSLSKLLGNFNFSLSFICLAIAFVLLVLIVLKIMIYPGMVFKDFKHPVILSSFGTFSMALMLIATFIPHCINLLLWCVGFGLHILIIILFSYKFVFNNFSLENVYPSYWIVYVGITMGAITGGIHGFYLLNLILFCFGFVSMLITLPLISYRYIKHPNVRDEFKPLICIYTALFSILIVGYTSLNALSYDFLIILFSCACIFYIFALYMFLSLKDLDFYPSFSAFTFPFVISATATFTVSNIFHSWFLSSFAYFEIIIAVILVFYVLFKYLKFYIS